MADKDFDRVWDVHRAGSQGDFIQCDPLLSKHEFLRYLRDERGAVFHGSNNPDIIIFEPRTATGTGPGTGCGLCNGGSEQRHLCLVCELCGNIAGEMQLITGRAEGGYAIALPGEAGERMPCRCYFGGPQEQLDLFDAEGHEEKVPIAEVEDLRQYGEVQGKRASQWA